MGCVKSVCHDAYSCVGVRILSSTRQCKRKCSTHIRFSALWPRGPLLETLCSIARFALPRAVWNQILNNTLSCVSLPWTCPNWGLKPVNSSVGCFQASFKCKILENACLLRAMDRIVMKIIRESGAHIACLYWSLRGFLRITCTCMYANATLD